MFLAAGECLHDVEFVAGDHGIAEGLPIIDLLAVEEDVHVLPKGAVIFQHVAT